MKSILFLFLDHLEHFFNSVRSCLGSNNNPTSSQFAHAFKKLLFGATNKSKVRNCLSQDHMEIMTIPSHVQKAAVEITCQYDIDDEFDSWLDLFERGNVDNEYKDNVVSYVSGFIQRKLRSKYACVYCQNFLLQESNLSSSKLISTKTLGGLIKPNEKIVQIVNVSEKILSQFMKEKTI